MYVWLLHMLLSHWISSYSRGVCEGHLLLAVWWAVSKCYCVALSFLQFMFSSCLEMSSQVQNWDNFVVWRHSSLHSIGISLRCIRYSSYIA